MPAEVRKMPSRRADSQQTREALVCAAERLFGLHGIEAVSVNEITREAGQKNKSALSYHFGSREALIQAVLDRHAPQVTAERECMLDALEAGGQKTLKGVVEALVLPLAALLEDADGGVAYLRINAELLGHPELHLFRLRQANTRKADRLMQALQPLVSPLPPAREKWRMQLVGSLLFHALAEQARLQQSLPESERRQQQRLCVRQLVEAITAMLSYSEEGKA